jgi:hypothetical protein
MLELKLFRKFSHLLHIFSVLLKQSNNLNLIGGRIVNLIWHSVFHDHVVDELVGEFIQDLQCQFSHTHILEIIVLY